MLDVAAALLAVAVIQGACLLAAAALRRDVRLVLIAVTFLTPLLVSLWLPVDQGRVAYAAAAVVGLPALLIADHRAGATVRATLGPVARTPFAPFAVLYAAAASFGLLYGMARGNDVVQVVGQTWTAALFLVGFCWFAPRLRELATPRFWVWFALAVAVLSLPGLADLAISLAQNPDVFDRVLAKTDFYAFVCLLLAVGLVAPRKPALGWALAGFFAVVTLVTFTRSYWLGAAVGCMVLAVAAVHVRPKLPSGRTAALGASVLAILVAAVAVSPIGGFAVDRVTQTHRGSGDTSVDLRGLELNAAVRQVRETPFAGIGSGGEFWSAHATSSSATAYGRVNFVHNAYVYFPLKFGVLGLAAVVALLVGLAQCGWAALRPGSAATLADRTWVAVFGAVLAASVTAPNLVDPLYSLFCGALAGVAGLAVARPAPAGAPARVGTPARVEGEPAWA
jgi:hypothetical protein